MQERGHLHGGEPCQEPVEVIEVCSVEIVGEPALPFALRSPIDRGHEHAAGVAPHPKDAQAQREPHAAERVGHLVVEELLEPDLTQHPSKAEENVLRHHPPQAHRDRHVRLVDQACVPGHAEPPAFHERRDDHGDAGHGHAGADALEHRDARVVPGKAPREGHDDAVVHWEHDDEGDVDEALERRGRHDKARARAEAPVHRAALLGEQSGDLRKDGRED
uniref:Uncharacterized protein n=1 Tax=Arundo donax TaxID=35708 RepID=A0A0A9AP19_ARUDO